MSSRSFFDTEGRLSVALVSLFHPLPEDFVARHADDLFWTCLSLNERLAWSETFLSTYRARLDPHRLGQNPRISKSKTLRAAAGLGPAEGQPPPVEAEPTTLGEVLWPWAHGCTLDKARPIASLTLEEVLANHLHLCWANLMRAPASPWDSSWSEALAPRFDEPHQFAAAVTLPALRRIYDDLCVPVLGATPLDFLEELFAREPHYLQCEVATSDSFGVLPTVQVPYDAFEGDVIAAAVNNYAQGPRRAVPIGPVQMSQRGPLLVVDGTWKDLLSSCVLPAHAFHEVKLKPTKKLAGEPVALRFDRVFDEGTMLDAPYDLLVGRRASRGASFRMAELFMSERLVNLLRQREAPFLSFVPSGMGFSIAEGVLPAPLKAPATAALPAVESSPEQSFFAAKRARLIATPNGLPASFVPAKGPLGKAEARLQRIFPEGFAAFTKAQGRKRTKGYQLLSPAKMYLLDQHGYELEHPESWGAVAIAENGLGDCLALFLLKNSDHELGATLYEMLHETGRARRFSVKLA